MISPEDIRNPARKSGYDHVGYNVETGKPLPPKPYQAVVYGGKRSKAGMAWIGPRRATAAEAAQDYCAYINGHGIPSVPKLRSAGHEGRRKPMPKTAEVQHALGVLRDARAQREGAQGYVYLIVEEGPALVYGKVGYSTNPQARVAELQEGNPRKLRLHAAKPGTQADESALHAKYIKQNTYQEWFLLTKELLLEWDVSHLVRSAATA